jgi:hypothetical protein
MSDHESTYVPKTGVEKWLDTRLPIIRFGATTCRCRRRGT